MPTPPLVVCVEDWQIQCCGSVFRCGDRVSWTARAVVAADREQLAQWLGTVEAQRVTHREEHHASDALVTIAGTVHSIRRVEVHRVLNETWRTTPAPPRRTVHDVVEADGYAGAMSRFAYVVELRPDQVDAPVDAV